MQCNYKTEPINCFLWAWAENNEVKFSPSSACWTCWAVGVSEGGEPSAWGYRVHAVDGRDFRHGESWDEAHWDLAVGADDGVTPVYGGAAGGGGGAWVDGMAVGCDVEAATQEGHALNSEIAEKEDQCWQVLLAITHKACSCIHIVVLQ